MIKAIETVYNGYRFRSRLEARWAVFFDTLGIKWEYEKEGYDLDGMRYLPDFWLPEQECFFEVKGRCSTTEEYTKAYLLCKQSQQRVYIAEGEIKIPGYSYSASLNVYEEYLWTKLYSYEPEYIDHIPGHIYPYCPLNAWVECPRCNKLEVTQDGYTRYLSCPCFKQIGKEQQQILSNLSGDIKERMMKMHEFNRAHDTPLLIDAYTAARSARFEHGEKG